MATTVFIGIFSGFGFNTSVDPFIIRSFRDGVSINLTGFLEFSLFFFGEVIVDFLGGPDRLLIAIRVIILLGLSTPFPFTPSLPLAFVRRRLLTIIVVTHFSYSSTHIGTVVVHEGGYNLFQSYILISYPLAAF